MFSLETAPQKAGARKPLPGQRQLLLRHLDGNLKDLIRDSQRLTVALEYHESLPQGCPGSQRWVKLAPEGSAPPDGAVSPPNPHPPSYEHRKPQRKMWIRRLTRACRMRAATPLRG